MDGAILLVSETLRLRPVEVEKDARIALPWYQDFEVLRGMAALGREAPYDLETVENMYRFLESVGECFLIELLEDRGWLPLGDAALSEKNIPLVIGRREYWNRGIAGQVLRFLVRRAGEKGFGKIGPVEIYRFNLRSLRLFRSAGFREVSSNKDSLFLELTLSS